jgi:hypothetical protein
MSFEPSPPVKPRPHARMARLNFAGSAPATAPIALLSTAATCAAQLVQLRPRAHARALPDAAGPTWVVAG